MPTSSLKTLKKKITDKYLDIAENLPQFQGGFIHELQLIRAHQKKLSERDYQRKRKPEDASILLSKINIVFTFQLEDFHLIRHSVIKLFRNHEKITNFIKSLAENESSIFASNWSNIGSINSRSSYLPFEPECIDKLPEHVRTVKVTYHRIMSSLASLTFSFHIDEEYSQSLNAKQNCQFLPQVNFDSINPLSMTRRYSTGDAYKQSKHSVRSNVQNLTISLKKWVENRIKLSNSNQYTTSALELYLIKGGPAEPEERHKWLKINERWLQDYGISISKFDSFRSSSLIYCDSDYPDSNFPVKILTSLGIDEYIDFKVESLSVPVSISAVINLIKNSLETQRTAGFQQLSNFDAKILKSSGSARKLKRVGVILNRLCHEFEDSKWTLTLSLEEVEELRSTCGDEEKSFVNALVENYEFRIESLKKAYNVVNSSITDYLEVQNIYAMYRLQKKIFLLSIVVTLATLIGVAANWKALVELWGIIIH